MSKTRRNVRIVDYFRKENHIVEFFSVKLSSQRKIFVLSKREFDIIVEMFGLTPHTSTRTNGKVYKSLWVNKQDVYDYVFRKFYSKQINQQELALDTIIRDYKYESIRTK